MKKLLKYEFLDKRNYAIIILTIIMLSYTAELLLTTSTYQFPSGAAISIPIVICFGAVSIVTFYNEITEGKAQLIYYTPNSVYKIVAAKIIITALLLFLFLIVINIFNVVVDYIPFIGNLKNHPYIYTAEVKNIIRIFAMIWDCSIIMLMVVMGKLVIILNTVFKRLRFSGFITAGTVVGLFYTVLALMNWFNSLLSIRTVLTRQSLFLDRGEVQSSMDMGSFSVIRITTNEITLNISVLIFNLIAVLAVYFITASIMKKRVFA